MSVISGMDVYIAQNATTMGRDGYRVQAYRDARFSIRRNYIEMLRPQPPT